MAEVLPTRGEGGRGREHGEGDTAYKIPFLWHRSCSLRKHGAFLSRLIDCSTIS